MKKVFNAPALSIEELETRQELSVIVPGELGLEVKKKDPCVRDPYSDECRCSGDAPIDISAE